MVGPTSSRWTGKPIHSHAAFEAGHTLRALLGVGLARLTFLPEPLPLRLGADTFPLVWSLWGALILVAIGTAVRGSRT